MISLLNQKIGTALPIVSLSSHIAYAFLENRLLAYIHRPILNPDFSVEKFKEKFNKLWSIQQMSTAWLVATTAYSTIHLILSLENKILNNLYGQLGFMVSLFLGSLATTKLANQFYVCHIKVETPPNMPAPAFDQKPLSHFINQAALIMQIALQALSFSSGNKFLNGLKILTQTYAFHQMCQMTWCSQSLISTGVAFADRTEAYIELTQFFLLKTGNHNEMCVVCQENILESEQSADCCGLHFLHEKCFGGWFGTNPVTPPILSYQLIKSNNTFENFIALCLRPFGGAPFNLGLRAQINTSIKQLERTCPSCRTPPIMSGISGDFTYLKGALVGESMRASLTPAP